MEDKVRNPVAKALKSPHLKPKRIEPLKGKGAYSRKDKRNENDNDLQIQSRATRP